MLSLALFASAVLLAACSLLPPSMDCGDSLTSEQCWAAYELAKRKEPPIDSSVVAVKVYLGCPLHMPAGCPAAQNQRDLTVEMRLEDGPWLAAVRLDRSEVDPSLASPAAP